MRYLQIFENFQPYGMNESNYVLNVKLPKYFINISPDGKYFLFEGKCYDTLSGQQVLNEEWELSDLNPFNWSASTLAHTTADIISIFAGPFAPIIDTLNAVSYCVEAQGKNEEEKINYYTMGAVTFAFAAFPGPMAVLMTPIKSIIKAGGKLTGKLVKPAIDFLAPKLGSLLEMIPGMVNKALKSKWGKALLGKSSWSKSIQKSLNEFKKDIPKIIERLTGKAAGKAEGKALAKGLQKLEQKEIDVLNKIMKSKGLRNIFKSNMKPSTIIKYLGKLGFKTGSSYTIASGGKKIAVKFIGVFPSPIYGVLLKLETKSGKFIYKTMDKFIEQAVIIPWTKIGMGKSVPFFVKRLTQILLTPDPVKELETCEEIEDITREQNAWFVDYQGDSGEYTVETSVAFVQLCLNKLGYPLPISVKDDGNTADGKFGPETREAIRNFMKDKGLEPTDKVDRTLIDLIKKEMTTATAKHPAMPDTMQIFADRVGFTL